MLQSDYRTAINQFPRFLQLATGFVNFYRVSFDMTISVIKKIADRSLDANARNTTAVTMTGPTILRMCLGIMVLDNIVLHNIELHL